MITLLQEYELPRLNKRLIKRKLNIVKSKVQKSAKAKSRKAKSKTLAVIRRQYFLTNAGADLRTAIGRNEDIFIATLISVLILAYSFLVSAVDLLLLFMNTAYAIAEISGISMILLAAIAGSVLAVIGGWIIAFALNMMAISIMDGSTNRQVRSVRLTMRKSLQNASRVFTSWVMLAALAFGPIVAAAVPAYLYVTLADLSLSELLSILPKAIAVSAAWLLYVFVQYSLVPYVSLFETKLPLKQTFNRSRILIKRKGRLFLISLYSLVTAMLFGGYKLAELIEQIINIPVIVLFTAEALVALLLTNGILVMLYRKRKLARKN